MVTIHKIQLDSMRWSICKILLKSKSNKRDDVSGVMILLLHSMEEGYIEYIEIMNDITWWAIACAVFWLSPVSKITFIPIFFSVKTAFRASLFTESANATKPVKRPK